MVPAAVGMQFAGQLAQGLGQAIGGGGGPMISEASVDGRGFFDGSGWSVATGGGRATGGTSGGMSQPGRAPDAVDYGIAAPMAPMQAGPGAMVGGLLLVALLAVVLARRRKS
jgi:hypothetical protein